MLIALKASLDQIRTVDYPGFLQLARDLGVAGIELSDDPNLGERDLDRIQSEVDEMGLAVACYQVPCGFSATDPRGRESNIAKVQEGIDRALSEESRKD